MILKLTKALVDNPTGKNESLKNQIQDVERDASANVQRLATLIDWQERKQTKDEQMDMIEQPKDLIIEETSNSFYPKLVFGLLGFLTMIALIGPLLAVSRSPENLNDERKNFMNLTLLPSKGKYELYYYFFILLSVF